MRPNRLLLGRRTLLAAMPALALPLRVLAAASRFTLAGTMEQGALIVGKTEGGTHATLDGDELLMSPNGDFVFGFSRDRAEEALLALRYADGSQDMRTLAPVPRAYDIQRIDGLPQDSVTPPPEILARINSEAAAIRELRARGGPGTGFAEKFDWPVPGTVSSVYGSQRILNGTPMAPHLGIDIAAPTGTPIHAPAEAVVAMDADHYLNGGFTLLDHGQGVTTCYLHQSRRLVGEGDRVARGQVIGEIGQTGRATGPNLHWGLNWFLIALDPALWTGLPAPQNG